MSNKATYIIQVESLIKNKGWNFQWNEHLGYITTCPSNLGSGLRASVHVKVPKLAKVNKYKHDLHSRLWTF